nr:phage protease [Marivibrio halodurans]
MPAGRIVGADGRGWTVDDMDALIAQSMKAGRDLPIDYDHQIDLAAVEGVGGRAPAAGWISELHNRDGALWGRVNWTDRGGQAIASREYRYISPAFLFREKDGRVSQVLRASLTNNPNLDMKALNARRDDKGNKTMDILAQLIAALGLDENTDEAKALQHVRGLAAKAEEAAALATVLTKLNGAAVDTKALMAAESEAKRDAAADTVVTALQAKLARGKDGGDGSDTVTALNKTVMALQSEVNALRSQQARGVAEGAVDHAIKAGKLTPATRDWALNYAAQDPAGFAAFVKAQPTILNASKTTQTIEPPKGESGLTEDEMAVCAALGVTPEEFKKQA